MMDVLLYCQVEHIIMLPRVVLNWTISLEKKDYNDWRMYGRSKLANILFANALQKRFEGSNRTANSVHPGVIRTNLARHILDAETMFEHIKKRVTIKSVEQGAATQCLVADQNCKG